MNARHSKRMSGNGNPAWKGGTAQNYQVRTMRMSDIVQQCTWCGRTDGVQVHHIDHDTSNGAPENLIWLCHNCNVVEANLWNLEQKGFAAHEYDPDGHILTIRFGDNRALSGAEGHRCCR
jgi:5-methylcytosine-specific restriction endonuclease McrA